MSDKREEFRKKLLATFKIEAEEHLKTISSGLIELEESSAGEAQAKIVERIFREAHSMKGAARAVSLTEIESICEAMENVFAALKRQKLGLSPELFDTLHRTVDNFHLFLSSPPAEMSSMEKSEIDSLLGGFESVLYDFPQPAEPTAPRKVEEEKIEVPKPQVAPPHEEPAEVRPIPVEKPTSVETIRIPAARLDELLLQAEELISAKLMTIQRAAELREMNAAFALCKEEWQKLYPEIRKFRQSIENTQSNGHTENDRHILKLFDLLDWSHVFIESQERSLASISKSADQDQRSIGAMVDHLLKGAKKVRMTPFEQLLELLPKAVRELSRDKGKEVELVIRREELEIDRRILEEMKDPLMHLVRNCIDHGIEKPEERVLKGKAHRGKLTVAIAPKGGNKIEIIVADDGAGIDKAKVCETAVRIGQIATEKAEAMSEQELLSLVFLSGVSTSPVITDISGRGLGLAIVQEKVERLGGAVSLETKPDEGTSFRMVLPLTLATFRGIQVRVAEDLLVVPTASVERVMRLRRETVKTIENRETIQVNGTVVPLVQLADVLELPGRRVRESSGDMVRVIVVGSAEKRIAFQVDEVVGEHEVLVKNLGKQLLRVRNVAGATVLGTGKVAPILNVSELMKSAVMSPTGKPAIENGVGEIETASKSILIAEDSITSRMLLKNILETAGYGVRTAVDGMDALTILRTEGFDLLISDVDMPRMNGFDLTASIRTDKKLAELPVILVTALGSREDRERGVESGANAYIVKSDFDQANLLEAIRRLI